MPKRGYTNITIDNETYEKLKMEAKKRSLSIPELIRELLNANTRRVNHRRYELFIPLDSIRNRLKRNKK